MTIRIRTPRADEADGFERAIGLAFNDDLTAGEREHGRHVWETDRDLAAYDGKEIVGTAGSYGFRLSVPGGEVPCAGVHGRDGDPEPPASGRPDAAHAPSASRRPRAS